MDWLAFFASLAASAASVAWPVTVGILAYLFRDRLRALLSRPVQRLKLGPFELLFEAQAAAAKLLLAERGLSRDRIEVEAALYDAVLRLQSARALEGVQIPPDLEAEITRFWQQPESIGMRPGGEADVSALTRRVMERVPVSLQPQLEPARKPKALEPADKRPAS